MSSLIARVRVEMGKQEHNPTLMIYQDTDIPSLVTDFVEAWEMPNAIYDKIYLEVVGELRKHGLMEADTSEDQSSSEHTSSTQQQSYTNSFIQQLETPQHDARWELQSPIHKLFGQFKGDISHQITATPESPSQNLTSHPANSQMVRRKNLRSDSRASLSFRTLVENRIRDLYRAFMGWTEHSLPDQIISIIQQIFQFSASQFLCQDEFIEYAFQTKNAYRLYRLFQQYK